MVHGAWRAIVAVRPCRHAGMVLRACLLASFAYAVWYVVTRLPGSRIDRRDQWRGEAELRDLWRSCPHNHTESTDAGVVVSTCSAAADAFGYNQKVVSFVYSGDKKPWRKYLLGVHENARLVSQFYPGWRMRVYHSVTRGSRWWEPLLGASCHHDHVDLCYVPDLRDDFFLAPERRMWRILPAADPLVDIFVTRDLDSRISSREAAAVAEWLQSNMTFHAMRDYPDHDALFMAGMWGARVHLDREALREAVRTAHSATAKDDQGVLDAVVWPLAPGRVMQHDAYTCQRREVVAAGCVRPFPTRRRLWSQSNFVGALFSDEPLSATCPVACRPKEHPDWTTC